MSKGGAWRNEPGGGLRWGAEQAREWGPQRKARVCQGRALIGRQMWLGGEWGLRRRAATKVRSLEIGGQTGGPN